MKRISLIGLSLVLILFMGTLASAAGTFNINYVVDGLNIQDDSTELNFKGHTLRFSGSFDLNDRNFIEGNFITGKITTLLDKEGNPIDVQGVTILGPMSGNYLGVQYRELLYLREISLL